jgi:hypothetical protein
MRTMTEFRLGQDGVDYVRSCLSQGSDLCAKLLELTFADGEAFAPVPDDISPKRAKQFDVGGLVSRRETLDWLTAHLRHLFHDYAAGTFVLQDVWAKPEDVTKKSTGTKRFFHDDNTYYFLDRDELTAENVAQTLRAAQSYLTIAVFAGFQFPLQHAIPCGHVNGELITDLARATREIFVSAYDQEGLVVWRKSHE